MKQRRSWVGHHDFANSGDLRREAEYNQRMIEAQFYGDINQFRMDVAHTLEKHGALSEGSSLAVFEHEQYFPDQPASLIQTMVHMHRHGRVEQGVYSKPSIRIITNEMILDENNDKWLAIDFSADCYDDTQYFVDVFDLDKPDYPDAEMYEEGNPYASATPDYAPIPYAPYFDVSDEGTLVFVDNLQPFTPSVRLETKSKRTTDRWVAPFGNYKILKDKVHALAVGNELLRQIANVEPSIIQFEGLD